jgi:hypothetical protein
MAYSKKRKLDIKMKKIFIGAVATTAVVSGLAIVGAVALKKRGYTCVQDVLDELGLFERYTLNEDDCAYCGTGYPVCTGADACPFCRGLAAKTSAETTIHVDGFDPALQKAEQPAETK